ncbi:S-layer homology domain-containing protein [uncultured Dysosmobacter sp.]|uniref:S-layer homology domain-containing protein n=1 Tax=uncultured Dysosmobacter sp. TaxID=2591384 RepID=UPI0026716DAA|nr:S-layer homology domain-containing protein [uncultured Dysosmobacter sp.]
MKKRILSCLMALALCLTLLPATALAEDGHATHPICGKTCSHTGAGETEHPDAFENANWLASSDGKLRVGSPGGSIYGAPLTEKDNYVILNDGYYYLSYTADGCDRSYVRSLKTIKIQGNVTICLNGKQIEKVGSTTGPVFEVPDRSTLTLTDCTGNGQIIGGSNGSGVYVNGGILNLYSGQITKSEGQTGAKSNKYGGGVYVNSGNFNMYGGSITGNSANYGGGVYVNSGTFTMDGGDITRNSASYVGGAGVYVEKNGNFIMNNDARVTENTIGYGSTGGSVYVNGGTFEMHDNASVTGNKAHNSNSNGSCGGGVYVKSGTFTMNGNASVTGNKATLGTLNGAGVYVEGGTFTMNGEAKVMRNAASGNKRIDGNGGGVYVSKSGTFNMNDGTIGGATAAAANTADTYGGGVYVESGTFNMNDGTISGNTAPNGGGVYASSGKFNMNDGAISGNTAKGNGGGVFVHDSATFTVSRTPTVTGNTNTTNSAASNVYLMGSAYITIGEFGLTDGASIGVTKIPNSSLAEIVIAEDVNEDCSGKFSSDDETREVKHDGNQLVLKNKETQSPTHTHSWTYRADKATITATCANTDGNCDNKDGGSVIITPPDDLTYNGTEKPAMVKGLGNWKSAFSENISITYEQKNGNTYTNMNGVVPTKVGKYKASITVKGATASVVYEILNGSAPAEKTDPTYTAPTAKSGLVYTGENQPLIDPGSTNHGRMWYKLGTDDVYSTLVPMAKDAGSYTVYYKVEGDATHNDVAEKSIEVRIEKAQLSGTPTFTKVTEAGKTLKDVTLTKPESWPDGKFEWGNGVLGYLEDKPLVQGKAYSWLYLADNYYAEGTVVLWADPSSPGGGSSSGGSGSYDSNPIIKTETKNNADGSTTKTETRRDGSVTQTTTGKDGSVSKTETKKDGSSVTENKAADGSTGTVKTDKHGQTEAKTALSNKAIEDAKKNGEAVKAPVEVKASHDSSTAPTVKVELPKGAGETKVEIPVSNVKPGTVAVLVHPDGTEEIVKNSVPTEDGIQLTVNGGATVKIVDNSKNFIDTRNHWAEDAIDFVSARGLVNGMSDTIYAPNNSATRAQLWTILARQNDANLSGGNTWYEKAQLWSKDKGISDGTEPNAAINRAQMVTMLWRAVGQPAAGGAANFNDVPANSYYAQAVAWAVENGITTGVGGGRFDPAATCTRAQIAAFLTRLYAEK